MNRMLKISFAETGHEKDNAQSSYTTELNPDENGAFTHVLTTEEIASLTEKGIYRFTSNCLKPTKRAAWEIWF